MALHGRMGRQARDELGAICVGRPHALDLFPTDELVGNIIKTIILGHADRTRCVEIVVVSGRHPHTEDCDCFSPPEPAGNC